MTTRPSGSAKRCRCDCQAPSATSRRSTRSSDGCRSSPAICLCPSRNPWPEELPAAGIRGRGLCTDGLAALRRAFRRSLYRIDPAGGPPAGQDNFYRGAPLATYDAETRNAIDVLGRHIDADAATDLWEASLAATWNGPAVWVHGDVSAENLLVEQGQLSAVIDFGCAAVGDPACDTTIAWTFFSGEGREALRANLPVDEATWVRGRGWALWKALINLIKDLRTNPQRAATCRRIIDDVIAERLAGI